MKMYINKQLIQKYNQVLNRTPWQDSIKANILTLETYIFEYRGFET